MKIVISSGHGQHVAGASGYVDEVTEARKVVDKVADYLSQLGVEVTTFHDDVSTTVDQNLARIVDFHNDMGQHDLDCSIHFNAYEPTDKPRGCEVFYISEDMMATDLSAAMADAAGFINRGAKYDDDLYFLRETLNPSVLVEVCFVDSKTDVQLYEQYFDELCRHIAITMAGGSWETDAIEDTPRKDTPIVTGFRGKCSWFGGPNDVGVSPSENLAFIFSYDMAPELFLATQPTGTTGLARRLDPTKFYVACRWNYDITSKDMLGTPQTALVIAKRTGMTALARPADWGPNEETGRAADLSPGLIEALGIDTDDEVVVLYPVSNGVRTA